MSENIAIAFKLMFVGMITVFFILVCVILLGKVLIALTNKYKPVGVINSPAQINQDHVSAINSAIQVLTNGKKVVQNIERKQ